MNAYKTRYITYKFLAGLCPDGKFTRDGLPINRDTAAIVVRALATEAIKLGLLPADTNPDSISAHYQRHYNNDGVESIVPYRFRWASTGMPVHIRHPFNRLIRRLTCKLNSPAMRTDIQYHTQTARGIHSLQAQDEHQTARQRIMARPLTPDSFKYDRALGVEIELTSSLKGDEIIKALPIWCRRAEDGSLRSSEGRGYTHEIRALFLRSQMEPRLHRLCTLLSNLDCAVNKSCGLHVHLDMRGETRVDVKKRATMMATWLQALQELVPPSRRTNDYCKWGISERDRYHAVNFVAFEKYRTLEIRLHSGTIDYTKILAWIRLCELLAAVRHKPKAGGCIATLEQLPLASHDLAYWRSRHQQINPHMYSNQGTTSEQE